MEKLRKLEAGIPNAFTCPISLEVMLEPVTLSSGHTFERKNIERWFREGNFTCPMTMAKLSDISFVSNHTLRKMIQKWFTTNWLELFSAGIVCPDLEIPTGIQINLLVRDLQERRDEGKEVYAVILRRLRSIAKGSDGDRAAIVKSGAVAHLLAILLDSSDKAKSLFIYALGALSVLPLTESQKRENLTAFSKLVPGICELLKSGSVGGLYAAEMLANIADVIELRGSIGQYPGVVERLLCIIDNGGPYKLSAASIRMLLQLCRSAKVRIEAANLGAVGILVENVPTCKRDSIEKCLAVLDLLCSTAEGRVCMIEHPLAIPTLVRFMTRISEWSIGYSTSALWAVCKADPENGGVAAIQAGALQQLLLVIQSDCSLCTKHKAIELLKLLRHLWEFYQFPSQYAASATIP